MLIRTVFYQIPVIFLRFIFLLDDFLLISDSRCEVQNLKILGKLLH